MPKWTPQDYLYTQVHFACNCGKFGIVKTLEKSYSSAQVCINIVEPKISCFFLVHKYVFYL